MPTRSAHYARRALLTREEALQQDPLLPAGVGAFVQYECLCCHNLFCVPERKASSKAHNAWRRSCTCGRAAGVDAAALSKRETKRALARCVARLQHEASAREAAEAGEAGEAAEASAREGELASIREKRWYDALWAGGAPFRAVYGGRVRAQPVSNEGIMGSLRPRSTVRVLAALAPSMGDVFLDVGCGDGQMLAAMHAVHAGVRLRGIDTDPQLVGYARDNLDRLNTTAQLEARSVADAPPLGGGLGGGLGARVSLAYSFSEGLVGADVQRVLLDACLATPTLKRVCLVHSAVAPSGAIYCHMTAPRRATVVRHFQVHQMGPEGASYRAWVWDVGAERRAAAGGR